jgi:hypothetical protein
MFEALDAYQGWESKVQTKYDVYYFEDNKRLQINEVTETLKKLLEERR